MRVPSDKTIFTRRVPAKKNFLDRRVLYILNLHHLVVELPVGAARK